MNKKLKRAVPYALYFNFIGWPLAGTFLLIASIINFNRWGATFSMIGILIGVFTIIYGTWALKRAWARM